MRDTIAVYALWRDSEPYIERTLSQFEDLELLDYDFEYYFYENDSEDNTISILKSWLKGRKHKFKHENLNAKKFGRVTSIERMELLCECRNKCKELLKDSDSSYTILVDSDVCFTKENLTQHINSIKSVESCVLITPNIRQNIPDYTFGITEDSYYDVHPFFDKYNQKGLYWADCPFKNGIDRMNWYLGNLIKCNSCFGGFALIRTEILKKVNWSTDGECDHVNFCKKLLGFGEILIDPKNKVFTEIDTSKYNLEDFKQMARNQKLS